MVTVCAVGGWVVLMLNDAAVSPWGTVTVSDCGTDAQREPLLERTAVSPPAGAGPEIRMVPVTGKPPLTEVADSVRLVNCGRLAGLTISDTACFKPAAKSLAVMVAVTGAVTDVVLMVKLAEVWPAGMLTLNGASTAALLELRVMVAPPAGAF